MDVLVAKRSAVIRFNGQRLTIQRGVTTANAKHPIVEAFPDLWGPQEVRFDVEQATAAPGEKRHVTPKVGGGTKQRRGAKTSADGPPAGEDSE